MKLNRLFQVHFYLLVFQLFRCILHVNHIFTQEKMREIMGNLYDGNTSVRLFNLYMVAARQHVIT